MSDRTAQAIALRDHVIKLMEGNSKLVTLGLLNVQTWKRRRFHATLNTSFNPLHEREAAAPGYVHATARQRAPKPMPYELSLWAGSKVLSMEWEQGGEVRIVTFKRGDWDSACWPWNPAPPDPPHRRPHSRRSTEALACGVEAAAHYGSAVSRPIGGAGRARLPGRGGLPPPCVGDPGIGDMTRHLVGMARIADGFDQQVIDLDGPPKVGRGLIERTHVPDGRPRVSRRRPRSRSSRSRAGLRRSRLRRWRRGRSSSADAPAAPCSGVP
jgi:hypothetical protein